MRDGETLRLTRERLRFALRTEACCSSRLSLKPAASGPPKTMPAWLRTSLKALVSRGFCSRPTCVIGSRTITWRGS